MERKTITLDARAQHRLSVLNHVLAGELTAAGAAAYLGGRSEQSGDSSQRIGRTGRCARPRQSGAAAGEPGAPRAPARRARYRARHAHPALLDRDQRAADRAPVADRPCSWAYPALDRRGRGQARRVARPVSPAGGPLAERPPAQSRPRPHHPAHPRRSARGPLRSPDSPRRRRTSLGTGGRSRRAGRPCQRLERVANASQTASCRSAQRSFAYRRGFAATSGGSASRNAFGSRRVSLGWPVRSTWALRRTRSPGVCARSTGSSCGGPAARSTSRRPRRPEAGPRSRRVPPRRCHGARPPATTARRSTEYPELPISLRSQVTPTPRCHRVWKQSPRRSGAGPPRLI